MLIPRRRRRDHDPERPTVRLAAPAGPAGFRPGVRRFFAPPERPPRLRRCRRPEVRRPTVDELAATPGRPTRAAAGVAVEFARSRAGRRRRDRGLQTARNYRRPSRDIERLFGVGKVRAAALMKTFGAELVGNQRTLPRTKLLQQLKKHRGRTAFRVEEERRARLVDELQPARLIGFRFKGAGRDHEREAANLPDGVSVERGRIEVRFEGAEDAGGEVWRNEDGSPGAGGRGAGDRDGRGPGHGAVPGVLRGADRERQNSGGVRAGGGAIPRVVRGARPRAARRIAAPRGRLHPDPPRLGPHGEAAPGRAPHARRLARRQPGPPGEPRRGRPRAEST